MGGSLSINHHNIPTHAPHNKRHKTSSSTSTFWPQLIPGLPDEISLQILARIPRVHYLNLKAVSRIWKSGVTSPEIYKTRKELGTTEEWLYILMSQGKRGDVLFWYALDPVSKTWLKLPPIPNARASCSRKWNTITSLIWVQTLLSGCSVAAVDGCLYVLGGLSADSTLTRVWKYDPVSNSWSEANPMSVGRALCKTGVINGKLFAVGGVTLGRGENILLPLQSAEVFDPQTGVWAEIPSMPFSNANALKAALLTDLPKPVATGLASYRGKLYVPQSLYRWPAFVDVGGEVYDPETDSWVDMPMGMGEGWPAKHLGTKRSVVVDGELYALDNSSSPEKAKIKIYNHDDDLWSEGDASTHDFPDLYSICRLAGLAGKLHVVAKDVDGNIAVIRAHKPDDLIASSEYTSESVLTSVPNTWDVIASRFCGSAMPVSCQSLDV